MGQTIQSERAVANKINGGRPKRGGARGGFIYGELDEGWNLKGSGNFVTASREVI